jgi:plastocyanin
MSKLIVGVVIALVIVFGGIILFSGDSKEVSAIENDSGKEEMKMFVMTGENFKFVMDGNDNPEIKVKEGDRVRIEFTSTSGFHDWVVDTFGATEQVREGEGMTSVEFVADKKGTFEYYCSVGRHRENGMKGNLVVE